TQRPVEQSPEHRRGGRAMAVIAPAGYRSAADGTRRSLLPWHGEAPHGLELTAVSAAARFDELQVIDHDRYTGEVLTVYLAHGQQLPRRTACQRARRSHLVRDQVVAGALRVTHQGGDDRLVRVAAVLQDRVSQRPAELQHVAE